ncbi:MAG: hypothetical protein ABEH78_08220 [Haloferacaceae archaeon]
MPSRRGLLGRLAALSGAVGLSGCARLSGGQSESLPADLPPNPHDLPARQHAWNDVLRTGTHGNPLAPRYHRVLLLDLDVERSSEAAATVERAMRTLEAAYDWAPDGLLHLLAWGSAYFARIGRLQQAPVRRPRVLSRTDDPDLLEFDAALVLASDVPSRLSAAEAAMFGERTDLNGVPVENRLDDVCSIAARRTGFIGEGLPAAHADAEGVPESAVPDDAPMFTGFFSGRRKTQATEARITIQDGQYAGGTTMHLSHLQESLDDWWNALDAEDRVARMFSPEFSPEEVADFTDDVPFSDAVPEHASEYGVVGHIEKVQRAREGGRPVILRRDFNTVDGGRAGVHFLALQRSLADLEKTRRAMNGWYLRDDHPAVTDRKNNGLLNFVTVTSRANFYVPPRDRRAFPK